MNTCVCCGKKVSNKGFYVCAECEKEYDIVDKPKTEWPKWLLFLINDTDREIRYDANIIDNIETNFSDLSWNDDSDGASNDTSYDPWGDIDASIDAQLDLGNLIEILTPRETEVLYMLLDGYNDEEVAIKLDVSRQMINRFHNNIKEKALDLGINIV